MKDEGWMDWWMDGLVDGWMAPHAIHSSINPFIRFFPQALNPLRD
jgi:hypothetical protein